MGTRIALRRGGRKGFREQRIDCKLRRVPALVSTYVRVITETTRTKGGTVANGKAVGMWSQAGLRLRRTHNASPTKKVVADKLKPSISGDVEPFRQDQFGGTKKVGLRGWPSSRLLGPPECPSPLDTSSSHQRCISQHNLQLTLACSAESRSAIYPSITVALALLVPLDVIHGKISTDAELF